MATPNDPSPVLIQFHGVQGNVFNFQLRAPSTHKVSSIAGPFTIRRNFSKKTRIQCPSSTVLNIFRLEAFLFVGFFFERKAAYIFIISREGHF